MLNATRFLRSFSGCSLLVVLVVLGTTGSGVAQVPYDRIVIFGDSLSDTGNGFALIHAGITPPDYSLGMFLVAPAPYARGGHHLSNGASWVELFARPLGLAGSIRPAFQSANPNATNYAVAAARAYDDGLNVNLQAQLSAFLEQFGGIAPADALYVIQFGGNDVRDALVAFASGGDGTAILQEALASIASAVTTLYAAGARHVLVWNVPDVGLTPAVRILDGITPGAALLASFLTTTFNANLAAVLSPLAALPGMDLVSFDAYALITAIVANPASFGLSDVENPCVTPNTPPFACQNPDDFLFWDGIHPTTAAHAIVARTVATLLGL
jgi:phospholipase/lecithinase/hemolysin